MLEASAVSGDGRAGHVRGVRTRCIGALSLAELQLVKPAVVLGLVTSYPLRWMMNLDWPLASEGKK